MTGCPFCAIADGTGPADLVGPAMEHTVAFRPLRPVNATHTLIIPKVHAYGIDDLPYAYISPLFGHARALAAELMHSAGCDGVNLIQSTGAAATQTVPHIHVHVIGRWDGYDKLPDGWPWATQLSPRNLPDPTHGAPTPDGVT